MANWYCGEGGSAAGAGTTWATRVDTIANLLALAYAAGDMLYVGPGVYRETVIINGDGVTVTSAGTVGVTNESTAVTGAGTNFNGGVAPLPVVEGDQLFIGNFRTAADGACPGAALTMTSATGNFDTDLVGYTVEIINIGAYIIGAVPNATTLTLTDRNSIGNPAGGGGYTYYITAGEGPYRVASVTDATNLTLDKPWSGPTISGCPYEIYRPVYLYGDVSGENTDGVGGIVRITGTDDETTDPGVYDRTDAIIFNGDDYWHVSGFTITTHSDYGVEVLNSDMNVFEDLVGLDNVSGFIRFNNGATRCIIRRAIGLGGYNSIFANITDASAVDNRQNVIENVYVYCGRGVVVTYVGGVTVKNLTMGFENNLALQALLLQAGNAVAFRHNLVHFCDGTDAVTAGGNGMVLETYNNYWQNADDLHANVSGGTVSSPSTSYLYLPALPLLSGRGRNPMMFFAPSQWDQTRDAAGVYQANTDLFGVHNEVAQTRRSWGAMHNYSTVRSTDQAQGTFAGSLYMDDVMEQQFTFPVKEGWDYVVTVWVYLEANYTGNAPEMVVMQPGQTSVTATSTGALGSWHQLSASFTTGAELDWISVALRSNNTANTTDQGVYWQDLKVN